jgi:hypothetical protein
MSKVTITQATTPSDEQIESIDTANSSKMRPVTSRTPDWAKPCERRREGLRDLLRCVHVADGGPHPYGLDVGAVGNGHAVAGVADPDLRRHQVRRKAQNAIPKNS